jgi:hypothetical protein
VIAHGKHLKFVGWIEAIDTVGNTWTQRVTHSNISEHILEVDWELTKLPLPDGAKVNTFVAVHRTKSGDWYAVNLSERMRKLTESDFKRIDARARRLSRSLGIDSDTPDEPTRG